MGLTYKSSEATIKALLEAGKLTSYRHSGGGMVQEGRTILLARTALPWVYEQSRLVDMEPAEGARPAEVQAALDEILRSSHPDMCEGYKAKCKLKRLDLHTANMPEVWEIRTDPPDAVRLFGFFVARTAAREM